MTSNATRVLYEVISVPLSVLPHERASQPGARPSGSGMNPGRDVMGIIAHSGRGFNFFVGGGERRGEPSDGRGMRGPASASGRTRDDEEPSSIPRSL